MQMSILLFPSSRALGILMKCRWILREIMNIMNDTNRMNDAHANNGGREYLWFAATLMVFLLTAAAQPPPHIDAREHPEIGNR
jgi:hypothetical protein